jgi:hypothetical protein
MSDTFHFHPSARRRFAPPTCRARLMAHVRRAAGRERNPLCRPVDRLRSRVVLAGLAIVLVALSFCWYPALLVDRHEAADAARMARHDHLVEATVAVASTPSNDPQPFGTSSGFDTRLGWAFPAGRGHDAVLNTVGALPKGARVPVWVDDTGTLTVAPRSGAEIAMDAAWAGVTALIGELALVAVAVGMFDRLLTRGSRHAWEKEWATVEPTWSGRS